MPVGLEDGMRASRAYSGGMNLQQVCLSVRRRFALHERRRLWIRFVTTANMSFLSNLKAFFAVGESNVKYKGGLNWCC